MKTQIYLDENGSSTLHHHSNHRISYDKNFVLMSVITISVLILLFIMLGARGQNVNSNQNNPKRNNTIEKKTIIQKQLVMYVPPDNDEDSLLADTIKTSNKSTDFNEKVFTIVQQMPSFQGGSNSLKAYLIKNTFYPQSAREDCTNGTVYVTFVVAKTGDIKDVKVLRGIGTDFDKEAIRVIKSMPRWIPGKQNGVAVNVQMNLPIKFSLQ